MENETKTNLFPLMEKTGINEINNERAKDLKGLESEEDLKKFLEWHGLKYKNNVKVKAERYINRKADKKIKAMQNQLRFISAADDFNHDLIITVEWKKSRMWGSNPKATTNTGFYGSSIGGCGYDKHSTATAEALNNDARILKLMYSVKEKALSNLKAEYRGVNGEKSSEQYAINQEVLGYGSGYGLLPHFEGGVGTSSHERIIKNIGLKMENIASTKSTDVWRIYKP